MPYLCATVRRRCTTRCCLTRCSAVVAFLIVVAVIFSIQQSLTQQHSRVKLLVQRGQPQSFGTGEGAEVGVDAHGSNSWSSEGFDRLEQLLNKAHELSNAFLSRVRRGTPFLQEQQQDATDHAVGGNTTSTTITNQTQPAALAEGHSLKPLRMVQLGSERRNQTQAGRGEVDAHHRQHNGEKQAAGAAHVLENEPSQSSNPALSVEDTPFAIMIMCSHKPIHYAALVESLLRSDFPNNTHIVVSHDSKSKRMERLTFLLRERFLVSHFFHPYSCSDAVGQDTYKKGFPRYYKGKELPFWKLTCAKHHWFWAMNRIWRTFTSLEWLYYLEEDYLVARHAASTLKALIHGAAGNSHFMGVMTECRDNLWTVSGALRRHTWEILHEHEDFYCSFNDYNWDLTLKQLIIRFAPENRFYLCAENNVAQHTGDFGKGITRGKEMPDDEIEASIRSLKRVFYGRTDDIVGYMDCPAKPNAAHQHTNVSVQGIDACACPSGRNRTLASAPILCEVETLSRPGDRKRIPNPVANTPQELHTPHKGLGAFFEVHQKHCMGVAKWFRTKFRQPEP